MCSSDVKLLLQEKYETVFKIYDHDRDDAHPLALVTLHKAENTSLGSPYKKRMREYAMNGVLKYFGLSFTEFLDLPRDILEDILEASREEQRKEVKALEGKLPPI